MFTPFKHLVGRVSFLTTLVSLLTFTAALAASGDLDTTFDGDQDMALAFPLCDLVTNEALNVNSTELVLTGNTLIGVTISGRDAVRVEHGE